MITYQFLVYWYCVSYLADRWSIGWKGGGNEYGLEQCVAGEDWELEDESDDMQPGCECFLEDDLRLLSTSKIWGEALDLSVSESWERCSVAIILATRFESVFSCNVKELIFMMQITLLKAPWKKTLFRLHTKLQRHQFFLTCLLEEWVLGYAEKD